MNVPRSLYVRWHGQAVASILYIAAAVLARSMYRFSVALYCSASEQMPWAACLLQAFCIVCSALQREWLRWLHDMRLITEADCSGADYAAWVVAT